MEGKEEIMEEKEEIMEGKVEGVMSKEMVLNDMREEKILGKGKNMGEEVLVEEEKEPRGNSRVIATAHPLPECDLGSEKWQM